MYETVDMGDLCFFLDIVFTPIFKPLEHEKYNEKILPTLYLTMYTRNIVAYIGNEKLMVHTFNIV